MELIPMTVAILAYIIAAAAVIVALDWRWRP
jgi:preprotein translocase subunit SecE